MMRVCMGVVAAVCAAGWFFSRLSVKILLRFMKEKNYTPPTGSELKACSRMVVEETFTFAGKH